MLVIGNDNQQKQISLAEIGKAISQQSVRTLSGLVRMRGLEPPRGKATDSKSVVSAIPPHPHTP